MIYSKKTQHKKHGVTTRRTIGKLLLTGSLAVALAFSPLFHKEAKAQQQVLHLYNWTDYTPPGLLKKFERETGIKVILDTYDSNETLLAKLKAGGGAGYDLFVPTHNFVPIFIEEGLAGKVDAKSMPNFKYVDDKWKGPEWDPNDEYTVPYQLGVTSFMFRSSQYKGKGDSWKEFFEPVDELKGKIAVFKSPDDVVSSALIYIGSKPCSEKSSDYRKVQKLLLKQKPFVRVYSSENINERLKAGEVWMTNQWDGNAKRARYDEGVTDGVFAFPKEGVAGFFDTVMMSSKAKNPEAAKKFMNFILDPKNMALISNAQGYGNAVSDSKKYMDKILSTAQSLNPPSDFKIFFSQSCSAKAIKLMDKVWTRLQR